MYCFGADTAPRNRIGKQWESARHTAAVTVAATLSRGCDYEVHWPSGNVMFVSEKEGKMKDTCFKVNFHHHSHTH